METEKVQKTHDVYACRHIVAAGSLDEGLAFYGPFVSEADARAWALTHIKDKVQWSLSVLRLVPSGH